MAMTPQQRSDAARKAAASRRANQANGTTSAPGARPTSRQVVNQYKATPAPNYRDARLVAMAAVEDAFILKVKTDGINDEARDAYARYQKLKARALAPAINQETQNEADLALRMSVLHLVKLAF